ncbi:TauD/TfdA family dioxygenase [Myxococcota bacterium]|nr:TauD/TfdA family dioxygenase [Myxococcota bacterium]
MSGFRSFGKQTLHYFDRPHEGIPAEPVKHPAAWHGREMAARDDWIFTCGDAERTELDAAVEHARATGRALTELSASDFPLPTLKTTVRSWSRSLRDGAGVVLLRGLPVDRWKEEEASIFFWCLGLHLGIPGAQNATNDLLGHVRDTGEDRSDPMVRLYRTAADIRFHCDAADAVGLLCLNAAEHGGSSRIASSVTVFNEIRQRAPDLVDKLFSEFALDVRSEGDRASLPWLPIPPCRFASGTLRTFFHGDYYRSAQRHEGAIRLGPEGERLLDLYEEIGNEEDISLDMDLRPGDVQLLSNHFVVHSRGAYRDPPHGPGRHLLRLWLSLPEAP